LHKMRELRFLFTFFIVFNVNESQSFQYASLSSKLRPISRVPGILTRESTAIDSFRLPIRKSSGTGSVLRQHMSVKAPSDLNDKIARFYDDR
jgi:hypothetical protein